MAVELIRSLLDRADTLCRELETELNKCLAAQDVTSLALNLTHEVIEKCANALDQIMTATYEQHIKPKLAAPPKRGGYFPATETEDEFKSAMGQWGAANIDVLDPRLAKILRSVQPMTSAANLWLKQLRWIAAQKHAGLIPQKKIEERRVTVTDSTWRKYFLGTRRHV